MYTQTESIEILEKVLYRVQSSLCKRKVCVQKSEKCMHCAETSCTNECACTYWASPNPLFIWQALILSLCLVSGAPKNLVLRVLVKKRLIHQLISGVCLDILANIVCILEVTKNFILVYISSDK